MKKIWTTLLVPALLTVVLGCQSPGVADPDVPVAVPETSSPEPLLEGIGTQASTPVLTQEPLPMTPISPPDKASEDLVALVRNHLAQRLNISPEQIVLLDVQPVVWRDAGLGCPKPGVDYIRVETPGFTILLEADGKTYRYHTDESKRFVQCNQ